MHFSIWSGFVLVVGALALPQADRFVRQEAPAASGSVQFAGVNIAGFDFGCATNVSFELSCPHLRQRAQALTTDLQGNCNVSAVYAPLAALGGPDGAGQMSHFSKDDGMNIFRLPVGWQWLVASKLGGTLDANNFGKYDQLVKACLATDAYCIIDVSQSSCWG